MRHFSILMIIVVLIAQGGCSYTPTRNVEYTPIQVAITQGEKAHGMLVVKELNEARSPRLYPGQFGSMLKTYIPLLPYIRIKYERLDESDAMHQGRKSEPAEGVGSFNALISKAIAEDLNTLGLFDEVRYIGKGPVPPEATYILAGDLKSTRLDMCVTSYMLGMAGVLLWILPIPLGNIGASVECSLDMTDATGNNIWSYQLKGAAKKTHTMYNAYGMPLSSKYSLVIKRYSKNKQGIDRDSFWAYHAAALRVGMVDVKKSLVDSFVNNEPKL